MEQCVRTKKLHKMKVKKSLIFFEKAMKHIQLCLALLEIPHCALCNLCIMILLALCLTKEFCKMERNPVV